MALPAFCDDWLPSVQVEDVAASVARPPRRGTRHRRALTKPLPYGTRLTVTQRRVPLADGGRTYTWLFRRARAADVTIRYLWQRACHFRFRAVFGDDGSHHLLSVVCDPETGRTIRIEREGLYGRRERPGARFFDWRIPGTGEARRPVFAPGAKAVPTPSVRPLETVREADYTLFRAAKLARRTVTRALQTTGRAAEAARRDRMKRETARLDAYYKELQAEVVEPLGRLFHQIASARVRRQLTRSVETAAVLDKLIRDRMEQAKKVEARCEEEIEWLKNEWRLRREELEAQQTLDVHVALVSAAWTWLPRLAVDARLEGEAARSVTALWDVGTAWPVSIECDACGRPGAAYTLCKGGHLSCSACSAVCPYCDRGLCPSCTARRCVACETLLCRECGRKGRGFYICPQCAGSGGIGTLDGWTAGLPGAGGSVGGACVTAFGGVRRTDALDGRKEHPIVLERFAARLGELV